MAGGADTFELGAGCASVVGLVAGALDGAGAAAGCLLAGEGGDAGLMAAGFGAVAAAGVCLGGGGLLVAGLAVGVLGVSSWMSLQSSTGRKPARCLRRSYCVSMPVAGQEW